MGKIFSEEAFGDFSLQMPVKWQLRKERVTTRFEYTAPLARKLKTQLTWYRSPPRLDFTKAQDLLPNTPVL